jgi:hypothetical protein
VLRRWFAGTLKRNRDSVTYFLVVGVCGESASNGTLSVVRMINQEKFWISHGYEKMKAGLLWVLTRSATFEKAMWNS